MPVRSNLENPYDANLSKSTMGEKFVTNNPAFVKQHEVKLVPVPNRIGPGCKPLIGALHRPKLFIILGMHRRDDGKLATWLALLLNVALCLIMRSISRAIRGQHRNALYSI